jgi:hypothetical protein
MTWLIIAGGVFVGSALQAPELPDMYNFTLAGERVIASDVVCRNRWGTPMLPDGKGGYSLIAPINEEFIARSVIIPPKTYGPVFRPMDQPPAPVVE